MTVEEVLAFAARAKAKEQIAAYLTATNVSGFCKTPIEKLADEFVSMPRAAEQARELQRFVTLGPQSRVLEVGSGFGTFIYYCRTQGLFDCRGVEPGEPPYEATLNIAWGLLDSAGIDRSVITRGFGEDMPYETASFDAVYSVSCLEHTQDPRKVLAEVVRVLKPGGTAVLNFPNYGSWWEGHYNTIMLPHTPKWLFKLQVKAMGRSTDFADTLQFITYSKLVDWLKDQTKDVEIVSTGQQIWAERVRGLSFSEWNALGRVKELTGLVKKLGLDSMLLKLGTKLHWETPFILVLRRRSI